MLRLTRQNEALAVPQTKDKPYVYKHPQSKIRHNSSKLEHYLAVVDTYIELGQPEFFVVEPDWASYRPDVYCRIGAQLWCVEVQLSKVSNLKMQKKIEGFVRAYQRQEHDATNLWIRTVHTWQKLQAPQNIDVKIAPEW